MVSFLLFYLQFTDSFLCPLHSAVGPIHWIIITIIIFQLQNFHLVLLYIFYFFAERWYFSLVSSMFVIAHWSIFMTAALKIFLRNPNISAISVLFICWLSFFHSSWDFPRSWYDKWFLTEIRTFKYYVMRLWILFKPFISVDFFWHCSGKRRGWEMLPNCYQLGLQVQVPNLVSTGPCPVGFLFLFLLFSCLCPVTFPDFWLLQFQVWDI